MPPELESLSKEDLRKISDVKLLVSQLYEALNIEDYQLAREQELVKVILTFGWAILYSQTFLIGLDGILTVTNLMTMVKGKKP